jgi:hypothetical protein
MLSVRLRRGRPATSLAAYPASPLMMAHDSRVQHTSAQLANMHRIVWVRAALCTRRGWIAGWRRNGKTEARLCCFTRETATSHLHLCVDELAPRDASRRANTAGRVPIARRAPCAVFHCVCRAMTGGKATSLHLALADCELRVLQQCAMTGPPQAFMALPPFRGDAWISSTTASCDYGNRPPDSGRCPRVRTVHT